MKEIWKDIDNFFNFGDIYQVSNMGRVKSKERRVRAKNYTRIVRERIMSLSNDKDGYKKVTLCRNGKSKTVRVHILVAREFVDNPEGKPQVNHINGKKYDNNVNNLEWVTLSENRAHAYRTGLQRCLSGENCNFSKLKEIEVVKIKKLIKKGFNDLEISKMFNVSRTNITLIRLGKNWKHVKLND